MTGTGVVGSLPTVDVLGQKRRLGAGLRRWQTAMGSSLDSGFQRAFELNGENGRKAEK
jgi:hypothetical protein